MEALTLVSPDTFRDRVDIYILQDADGYEWTHKRIVLPSHRDKREWRRFLSFHGVTDAGELIFAPDSFSESLYILYLDPRRNSIREALFEGILGDEFRSRYGVGKHETISEWGIFFRTHIESLVSSL
ncbi:unnamed protein product [Thlaspi arvense]|uniref:F-box associated beta-propeller type 3 domain-containing protein n=1 Tax=Thlaspi arvense TaxID=13288 RepID=A0AAU9SIN0_THLAR|nr:unnamed protein product [Thlaspi arvense]